jgi:uncharacterized protein (DUF885 family)
MVRGMSTIHLTLASLIVAGCSPQTHTPAPATPAPPPIGPRATQSPASASTPPGPSAPSADDDFRVLSQTFLEGYLERSPVEATEAGEHRYDGMWPDVSPAGDAQLRAFFEEKRAALSQVVKDKLGAQNAIDAQIIEDQIGLGLYALDALKPRDVDPVYYTNLIGEGLDPLVNRSFGTQGSRLASLRGRLDGIPAVLAAAQQRLAHPARVHTETAIKQNKGLIGLVETELATRFGRQPELAASAKRAAAALHDFQTFLEKDLIARSDGSFRIGRERFAKKLAYVLEDDVDIDALAASARDLLIQTQRDMVETAKQVWSQEKRGPLPKLDTPAQQKAFVKQVLDVVAQDRPTNQTILADAKAVLADATAFVREKDLVRVPDEPVAVIEMPEYRRGVAIAYCDSSGPLEATPETFFAIAPTPSDWPKKRVESFYREYNHAMLADLVVHEAMPGHYLQLMHNNKFPSKLRAVFSSGPFVEGWAVYSEWLMAEKGFGGPRVKLERQKMVLRLAVNAILDHDIHAGTMEEKDALALMQGEAFQEEGEAVGKWTRARLTSAQLTTYFYGFSELVKLRTAAVGRPGFSERAYHDRLLSWGSPAMQFVRKLEAR